MQCNSIGTRYIEATIARERRTIEKIFAEKEQILQLINDQTQLAITTAVKKTFEDEREEYVIGLLKPYFTEGQIRCILEKKIRIQMVY